TEIEVEIAQLAALRSDLGNLLLMTTRHDSDFVDLDSVRYFYHLKNDLDAELNVALTYLDEKDFIQFKAQLNMLREEIKNYPTEYQAALTDFVNYIDIVEDLVVAPGKIANLDETQLTAFRSIAKNGVGISRHYAENVLCFFYNECDQRFIDIPTSMGQYVQNDLDVNIDPKEILSIYPNPANDGVVIQADLENLEGAFIAITDISG